LGLSIVYSTVKAHGGEIYARSRPGRGATFVLEIPACASPEEAAMAPPLAPRMDAMPTGRRGPTGRILIVEDEVNIVEMMREALTVAGHVVDAAQDGLTASSMLRSERYDLIITDLKMPNMSGRELYDVVRDINPSLARRIIFSTGDSVSADTQAFFKETGNPCLTKPFDLRDLYQLVNSALRDV
jgi:two-component system NtrC family sensor kinase